MKQKNSQYENELRDYYDDFAKTYEAERHHGYHAMIDRLELEVLSRYARGVEALEVGCGTGLLLREVANIASRAEGLDLSPGMLEVAKSRGLSVRVGSALELPYADASFDMAYSMKVLPHVGDIPLALAEMARVVRPGGYVVAEFYNTWSLRHLARMLHPRRPIGEGHREDQIETQWFAPNAVHRLAPPTTRFVDSFGIRVATVLPSWLDRPFLGSALLFAEQKLSRSLLKYAGGFYVAVYQKQ